MVQAAARSGLDFKAANPRSRLWWLKVRMILDRMEDENTLELIAMQHGQHIAVCDYAQDTQIFSAHWDAANELMHKNFCLNFPWAKDEKDNKRKNDIDAMFEHWRKIHGDPSDPDVQAKFLEVAKAMKRRGEKAKKEMFKDQRELDTVLRKLNRSRSKQGKK